jgi:hypothetical protein
MVPVNLTVTDEIPINKEQVRNTPVVMPWFPDTWYEKIMFLWYYLGKP